MAFVSPTSLTARGLDTPGVDPLTVGPVTFNSIECPAKLPIGAITQTIVEKQLIGGGKDTQSLGAQPKDVQWSGSFFQPNVDNRVETLQSMAKDGKEYQLTWRRQRYFCKVKDFTPGFRNANYCEYEITLCITRAANGALSSVAPVSVDSQVSALTSSLQSQNAVIAAADPTGSQSFQSLLAKVQAGIIAAGPIAQLTGSSVQGMLADVSSALSAVQSYGQNLTDGTPQFVATQQIISSLILLQKNIAQGQSQNTIRVQGASIFEIAVLAYEDVSQAFTLMQANGMVSPYTSTLAPTDITIPPLPSGS
jgi:hypothetical protein